jgi:hypothetical protein
MRYAQGIINAAFTQGFDGKPRNRQERRGKEKRDRTGGKK